MEKISMMLSLSPSTLAYRRHVNHWRLSTRSPTPRRKIVQATMHATSPDSHHDSPSLNSNTQPIPAHASCYGCGTSLQLSDPDSPGYVDKEKFEIKLRHRQLDQLLCYRCQALSNGAMIPGVADFPQQQKQLINNHNTTNTSMRQTGFQHKTSLVTPEELRKELQTVRGTRALIVLLIDLLDASGSILSKVRDLVGSNPIIVIGTKVDLLPQDTQLADVAEWLRELLAFKRISVSSVHLASSKTGAGIAPAVAAVRKERMGRDVYVMGAANVGKSAFIRALVKEMASMKSRQFDAKAIQKSKRLPVESAMPGTTLRLIPLEVFAAGGVLYDTPGLHIHHRMPHLLTPDENRELNLRKKLKGYIVSLGDNSSNSDNSDNSDNSVVYSWGNVAHVDVKCCPDDTQLVFYGPPILRVEKKENNTNNSSDNENVSLQNNTVIRNRGDDDHSQQSNSSSSSSLFAVESIRARGGLRKARTVTLDIPRRKSSYYSDTDMVSIADIAISGIPGWIAVQTAARGMTSSSRYNSNNSIVLDVYAPVGVEVFVRPSMPVGDSICTVNSERD